MSRGFTLCVFFRSPPVGSTRACLKNSMSIRCQSSIPLDIQCFPCSAFEKLIILPCLASFWTKIEAEIIMKSVIIRLFIKKSRHEQTNDTSKPATRANFSPFGPKWVLLSKVVNHVRNDRHGVEQLRQSCPKSS